MDEQLHNMDDEEVGRLRVRDLLQALTGGWPYIFVIMAYKERWDLYERIKRLAEEHFSVTCVRADEVKANGHDMLEKIHFLIRRSEFVIAEITSQSPNVYYELGYTVAVHDRPLMLIESGNKVPVDLGGLENLPYTTSRDGIRALEADLVDHLGARLNCETAMLRDMLEAPDPYPAYIVSSPRYPDPDSGVAGQAEDRRTFGDALGIRGLISAFAAVWGVGRSVELVSAKHSPPGLLDEPHNFYLIGSDKANRHSGRALKLLQEGGPVQWFFDPMEGYERKGNWPVCLYRVTDGSREPVIGRLEDVGDDGEEIWTEDYGVIIRGPHPDHENRLVTVLAGAHSLGTGAACLAATRPELIREVRNALPMNVLGKKGVRFWVLVKGEANREDRLLDPEGVTVERAGVYDEP